jgi:hypothetical protein
MAGYILNAAKYKQDFFKIVRQIERNKKAHTRFYVGPATSSLWLIEHTIIKNNGNKCQE